MGFLEKLFGKKKTETNKTSQDSQHWEICTAPDVPQPFGFKTGWLAIKGETPQSVIEDLQLKDTETANWKSGMEVAYYTDHKVFVSPEVDGYVLVIGLLDLSLKQIEEIAKKFQEVQYFLSHRIVDVYSWTKFQKGKLIRHYYFIGESGEVSSQGAFTQQEQELGLEHLLCSEDQDWDDAKLPDEETVLSVAAAWGVDPLMQKHKEEKSVGFLCTGL